MNRLKPIKSANMKIGQYLIPLSLCLLMIKILQTSGIVYKQTVITHAYAAPAVASKCSYQWIMYIIIIMLRMYPMYHVLSDMLFRSK